MASDILKTDLAFVNDLAVTPTGDLDIIAGTANMRGAIYRRLITIPGTLIHRPRYGCGILAFQNAPMTLAVKRQMAGKIATNLPLDPRIVSVDNVSITSADETPSQLVITVSVTIIGIGAVTFKYTPFSGVTV
jgi:phage baseplate assembly protein W